MEDLNLEVVKSWFTPDRVNSIIHISLNVFYAILIVIFTLIIAGWVHRRIANLAKKYQSLDPTLFNFLANVVKYLIMTIAVIFILGRFGIQTTSLAAMLGAAGLAVGLALQGTLSNLAAGVMLIVFRPFRIGDYIEGAGQDGTVEEISLFVTELKTAEGLKVIISNSSLWASSIKNYSANPIRRIDLTISVSYDSDLKQTKTVLSSIASADERVLKDPAPFIKVKNLGDSSVDFAFQIWTINANYLDTQCDMLERIKLALDEAGIDIPYPTTQTLVKNQ